MTVKDFVGQLRETIETIKSQGTVAIQCENLISYLQEIENAPEAEPTALQIEHYKANLQNWIESNKHSHEGKMEMFRSVITSGQSAIKTTFLLNGGASIAMLAFISHLAQFKASKVPEFSTCLIPFAFGVLGRVLNHQRSQMIEQARNMKERKLVSSLSYLVATRRNCLSRLKNRSTKLRFLYKHQSTERCSIRLERGGITA